MQKNDSKFKDYYEILSRNSLRGETYLIKLKNDPNVYVGIPVLRSNLSSENDDSFTLNVLQPSEKKGMYQKSISDIELLKPR